MGEKEGRLRLEAVGWIGAVREVEIVSTFKMYRFMIGMCQVKGSNFGRMHMKRRITLEDGISTDDSRNRSFKLQVLHPCPICPHGHR